MTFKTNIANVIKTREIKNSLELADVFVYICDNSFRKVVSKDSDVIKLKQIVNEYFETNYKISGYYYL